MKTSTTSTCARCGGSHASCSNCGSTPCSCGKTPCDPLAWPCSDALPGGLRRTRFFDGMRLTQAELENEQRYWRMKRQLTNRALGEGVVWGLQLSRDPLRRTVRVAPGYALDCCGNDLVVECAHNVSESDLVDRSNATVREILSAATERASVRAHVALLYAEHPEEPRVVHHGCAPDARDCAPSRVRETTKLCLVPWTDLCSPPFDPCASRKEIPVPPQEEEAVAPPVGLFADVAGRSVSGRPVTAEIGRQSEPTRSGSQWEWGPLQSPSRFRAVFQVDGDDMTVTVKLEPDAAWRFDGSPRIVEDGGGTTEGAVWRAPFRILRDPDRVAPAERRYRVTARLAQGSGESADSVKFEAVVTVTAGFVGFAGEFDEFDAQPEVRMSGTATRVRRPHCLDPLRDLFWNKDCPPCDVADPRGLLLLALFGWLRSNVPDDPARAIFEQAKELLLGDGEKWDPQTLFECWCRGLHYAGPRCTTEHHGVILGTVHLNRSGRILQLDRWEGRRHVLTGPLINHWGGQLGLAPLDVIAARFAQAVCCIASTGQVPNGDGSRPDDPPVRVSFVPIGDALLWMGRYEQVTAWAKAQGAVLEPGGAPSSTGSVGLLLGAMTRAPAAIDEVNRPRRFVSYRLGGPGSGTHLLVPSDDGAADSTTAVQLPDATISDVLTKVGVVPDPLAERPLRDAVRELAANAALPLDRKFDRTRTALIANGVSTLGAVLALEPEQVLERATRAAEPADASSVNALLGAAREHLGEIAKRLAEVSTQSQFGAFTRQVLRDPKFIDVAVEELAKEIPPDSESGRRVRIPEDQVRASLASAGRQSTTATG